MNAEAGNPFARDGYEILSEVLPQSRCNTLATELTLLHQNQKKTAGAGLGGLRNLLRMMPEVAELARAQGLKSIFEKGLGGGFFPVRALFFDKTPAANWRVAWHQDTTIAVTERIELPEFEGWSVKEGIIHVQPPRNILERMVTVRLHLDHCCADNGALKVISGSHLEGKLDADQIARCTREKEIVTCEVRQGGALMMRPLLLHSSSPAANPSHRRVLHIEYASDELPNGLKWFDC